MKKTIALAALSLMLTAAFSQAPQALNYQAIARNVQGQPLTNQNISIKISILDSIGSAGTVPYSELHLATTNQFGLFTLNVGQPTSVFTGTFAGINWGVGKKYMKVEMDPAAGTNYSDMGTTQLLSVPYALYAQSSGDNQWKRTGNDIVNTNTRNVGIGIATPKARLHVADSSVAFSAAGVILGSPGAPPVSGLGRRMMWYADKAAFRVGSVSGNQWDKDSIGYYSFASGQSTTASGQISTALGFATTASADYSTALGYTTSASGTLSTAMGNYTTASGYASTAMGEQTTASGSKSTSMGWLTTASGGASTAMGINTRALGENSTAMGSSTTASGENSTAMGTGTTASGKYSTAVGYLTTASGLSSLAMGHRSTAPSVFETAIGCHNTNYTLGTNGATVWNYSDRLFTVGNGPDSNNPSDALTILKNGDIKIGNKGSYFTNVQEGSASAGSSATVVKTYTITFPTAFNTADVRINVTAVNEQSNFTDEFLVTVKGITTTGATVIIRRMDTAAGWGQNLKLHWMAWE